MYLISIIFYFSSFLFCISNNEILVHMHRDMPWVFYDKHDDVSIYMYDDPNLRIVKIEKVLAPNLSKDQIFNTILNVQNYNNVITDRSLYSEFVTVKSDTVYGYQKTKNYIPFVRNRHLIFKLYKISDNKMEWVIIDKNSELYNQFKHRRIKELRTGAGRWEFVESDDVNLLIHYLYIDPNMNIPSFVLNRVMRNSAESVMEDVLNYIIKNNKK